MNELQCFIYASIISADNDLYPEEVKQKVIKRFSKDRDNPDWEYVFEPLGEDGAKYTELFKYLKDERD